MSETGAKKAFMSSFLSNFEPRIGFNKLPGDSYHNRKKSYIFLSKAIFSTLVLFQGNNCDKCYYTLYLDVNNNLDFSLKGSYTCQ